MQPLGFELRTAASGHDGLDLLAAGYQSDVIFMDLAMPGIDGWETIRRLRALGHGSAQLAVVSVNAFDKGLDNDVGLPVEDFILKPVRHSEMLDWLERRLSLTWLESPVAALTAPGSNPHCALGGANACPSGGAARGGEPGLLPWPPESAGRD